MIAMTSNHGYYTYTHIHTRQYHLLRGSRQSHHPASSAKPAPWFRLSKSPSSQPPPLSRSPAPASIDFILQGIADLGTARHVFCTFQVYARAGPGMPNPSASVCALCRPPVPCHSSVPVPTTSCTRCHSRSFLSLVYFLFGRREWEETFLRIPRCRRRRRPSPCSYPTKG